MPNTLLWSALSAIGFLITWAVACGIWEVLLLTNNRAIKPSESLQLMAIVGIFWFACLLLL